MRSPLRLVAAALLVALPAFSQATAPTASATAVIRANIQVPISITKMSDLNFGTMIATPVAGAVTVDPLGVRTAAGGVVLANTSVFGVSAAGFQVNGEANTTFSVILPASAQMTFGAYAMTVDTFVTDGAPYKLSVNGGQHLSVGATMYVGANQVPGLYSGSFTVTVAYN